MVAASWNFPPNRPDPMGFTLPRQRGWERLSAKCADDASEMKNDAGEEKTEVTNRNDQEPEDGGDQPRLIKLPETGNEKAEDGGDSRMSPRLIRHSKRQPTGMAAVHTLHQRTRRQPGNIATHTALITVYGHVSPLPNCGDAAIEQ